METDVLIADPLNSSLTTSYYDRPLFISAIPVATPQSNGLLLEIGCPGASAIYCRRGFTTLIRVLGLRSVSPSATSSHVKSYLLK
jgi:hypothetical protein